MVPADSHFFINSKVAEKPTTTAATITIKLISMHTKLYMRKSRASSFAGWLTGGLLLAAFGGWLISIDPDRWWKEIPALLLLWTGLIVLISKAANKTKWGVVIASGILCLLILNRLDVLDMVTLGIILVILGLISLVN